MFRFRKKSKSNLQNGIRMLIAQLQPKSPISEQYRTIRTNIQFSTAAGELQSLIVTSSGPGEGKSTTVANLAVVFAQKGKKVLLVDADMRRPSVHQTFRLENQMGLTNVLTKQTNVVSAIHKTEIENLHVLTSGPIPPNPAELLDSPIMEELLDELYKKFDLVLFDTPPILAVTDAQILANLCHGSILVVHSSVTPINDAQKGVESLKSAKGKYLGVVLNQKEQTQSNYYYYYGNK